MEFSDWLIPQREAALSASAAHDLPMLTLADEVSRLLVEVIQSISVDAAKADRTARDVRRHALWFMAIISFRALRAGMHSLSIGCEDQAVGYQRLIDELHNRAQRVRARSRIAANAPR